MYSQRLIDDLAASGLVPEDMSCRDMGPPEKAATKCPFTINGYVIPYFGLNGKPVSFYRTRLFDFEIKYKQPKDTPNHVYFPKGFQEATRGKDYIIITEGEKKAAIATKLGFPCVGLGGVDSWRNRIITMPGASDLKQDDNKIQAKIPAGDDITEDYMSPLALGLQDLIDFVLEHHLKVVIVFDSDTPNGTNTQVQRAAATLGFELRFRGIPFKDIRQILLPIISGQPKTALDDFLMAAHAGKEAFQHLLRGCMAKPSAFPRHPNIRDYLNKRLQKSKMSRKEMQTVSSAILSELDADGMRLRSEQEQQTYYFYRKTHKLIKADFTGQPNELTENAFGRHLYGRFGIGAADYRVIQWLGTQFTGEAPIDEVTPHRVFARPDNSKDQVIMQLSDGQYAIITAKGLTIQDNGVGNILFESDQVTPVNIEKLKSEFARQVKESEGVPLPNWWMDVLSQVRLKDKDKQRCITALLFYMAPWLHRWRGTQLPIEMTLGEAGSGKSTLQELRLTIHTGIPTLRNAPQDMKDWHASVANSGGLHVTDNVQLLDKNLRQRLSDEICRIITEPNPSIEMRKYYTNADLVRLPVRCTFGITAIQQPFLNADIIQRSIIIELDKAQDMVDGTLTYNSNWTQQQLSRFGGREAWLAHHFIVLMRFFQLVERHWNMRYEAKHRLINFEQSVRLMARIFAIKDDWIPEYLVGTTERAVTDSDWAFEGLINFAKHWRIANSSANGKGRKFSVQEIVEWASCDDEFQKCEALVNTRKLGRYLKTHKSMIISATGIVEAGTQNNRQYYAIK